MPNRKQFSEIADVLDANSAPSAPSLGIDLDGCVDEFPFFFQTLTHHWPGKVFVITFRSDRSKAAADLAAHNIRYDELILVSSFDAKAEVIVEKGILIYFDDQPEMLRNSPEDRSVMLVRNGGNFDFDTKKWLFSKQTGQMV